MIFSKSCAIAKESPTHTVLSEFGSLRLQYSVRILSAVVLFQQGSLLISGEKASLLSALEPITGVPIGIVFMHEQASSLY